MSEDKNRREPSGSENGPQPPEPKRGATFSQPADLTETYKGADREPVPPNFEISLDPPSGESSGDSGSGDGGGGGGGDGNGGDGGDGGGDESSE